MSAGVIPKPEHLGRPAGDEGENQGIDPAGVIDAALAEIQSWDGAAALDRGCGTGFHLPRLAG